MNYPTFRFILFNKIVIGVFLYYEMRYKSAKIKVLIILVFFGDFIDSSSGIYDTSGNRKFLYSSCDKYSIFLERYIIYNISLIVQSVKIRHWNKGNGTLWNWAMLLMRANVKDSALKISELKQSIQASH